RVHCLVRGADRLRGSLHRYGLSDAGLERVVEVPGDLALPSFGLSPEAFRQLADVDVVLHNGAWVNHLEPYARLRPANVAGTGEILRLAAARATPVHFVSTIDTAIGVDGNPPALDDDRRVT